MGFICGLHLSHVSCIEFKTIFPIARVFEAVALGAPLAAGPESSAGALRGAPLAAGPVSSVLALLGGPLAAGPESSGRIDSLDITEDDSRSRFIKRRLNTSTAGEFQGFRTEPECAVYSRGEPGDEILCQVASAPHPLGAAERVLQVDRQGAETLASGMWRGAWFAREQIKHQQTRFRRLNCRL